MNGIYAVRAILLLLFASVYAANGEDDKRYASNKAAGLFPFPRVGRAGGHLVWALESPADHSTMKRQGLFSFPRVGRNGRPHSPSTQLLEKRDGDQVAGMWFGPRLGRRDKREEASLFPWAFLAFKDVPGARTHEGFLNHLGRESNEDPEDPSLEDDEEFGPITAELAYQPRPLDKSLNKSNHAI